MKRQKKVSLTLCLTTLVLALMMAVGCGGEEVVSWIEEESTITVENEGGGTTTASGSNGTTAQPGTTVSRVDGGAAGTGPNGTTGGTTGKVDPEKYRGTTVRFATWKDPHKQEDGPVVDAFEKKYGIKVKIDTVAQDGYVNTIAGMIASKNAPDVFFNNEDWPASLSVLQPIEAMQLDLSDPIWDQGMIKLSTMGGKPFLVNTVGNIWSEVDCLFYNKRIFADNNIRTPEEYYKAGSWNYAAFEKCMSELKNAGYIGAYINVQSMLGAANTGFFKMQNGKVVNGVDTMASNVLKKIADWTSKGYIRPVTEHNLINNFIIGQAGMAITNAYGTKAVGYFANMKADEVGFCYIPDYDASHKAISTGIFRGWGLIRGAKNPVGAGLFLRYYLDVNNYNRSTTFLNKEAESFYFKLTTGVNTDAKNPYYLTGVCNLTNEDGFDYTVVATKAPNQVDAELSAMANRINAAATKVNQNIDSQLSALGLKK